MDYPTAFKWCVYPLALLDVGLGVVAFLIGPSDPIVIGVWSIIIATIVGLTSLSVAQQSARFNFLAANESLYELRFRLELSTRYIEVVSWGAKLCCDRAMVVSESATAGERRRFLNNFRILTEWVLKKIESTPARGYWRIEQLITCCQELQSLTEINGNKGDEILEAFEPYLGDRLENETFGDYIRLRQQVLDNLRDEAGGREEFGELSYNREEFLFELSNIRHGE